MSVCTLNGCGISVPGTGNKNESTVTYVGDKFQRLVQITEKTIYINQLYAQTSYIYEVELLENIYT